ncbi:MAG: hypothetical protein M3Y33_09975 [Actinomycetota bacterium]|nr:hypothetical protein [Actinomycetota bacterium]
MSLNRSAGWDYGVMSRYGAQTAPPGGRAAAPETGQERPGNGLDAPPRAVMSGNFATPWPVLALLDAVVPSTGCSR